MTSNRGDMMKRAMHMAKEDVTLSMPQTCPTETNVPLPNVHRNWQSVSFEVTFWPLSVSLRSLEVSLRSLVVTLVSRVTRS